MELIYILIATVQGVWWFDFLIANCDNGRNWRPKSLSLSRRKFEDKNPIVDVMYYF